MVKYRPSLSFFVDSPRNFRCKFMNYISYRVGKNQRKDRIFYQKLIICLYLWVKEIDCRLFCCRGLKSPTTKLFFRWLHGSFQIKEE